MINDLVLIRGGGDLATGVAARLWRSGLAVVVVEIGQPLAVRRLVSLAQAVFSGEVVVEDLHGVHVEDSASAERTVERGSVPVLVDSEAGCLAALKPVALVDARMTKLGPEYALDDGRLVVGLGPGFEAGFNCHAVVETQRGPFLGRVYWEGAAAADTRLPDPVGGMEAERVLRAPAGGVFEAHAKIGTLVKQTQLLGEVSGEPVVAPFDGALRGLLHDGVHVEAGTKVGDVDPRGDLALCLLISDKALAVGGGVLEALLSQPHVRAAIR